jgi:hypothetical protein
MFNAKVEASFGRSKIAAARATRINSGAREKRAKNKIDVRANFIIREKIKS